MTKTCGIGCPLTRHWKLFLVLLLLLWAAALPWLQWGEGALRRAIELKGYKDVALTLESVGAQRAVLTGVKLNENYALTMGRIEAHYSFADFVMYKIGKREQAPRLDVRVKEIVLQKDAYIVTVPEALMDAPLDNIQAGTLTVEQASMPFMGGQVRSKKLIVPLQEPRTIDTTLELKHVSVAALLEIMTGKNTSATGTISGALPVTLRADNTFLVHDAELKSDQAGKIMLPPELIPGDHPQVDFVRNVLKDFHYDLLSMRLNSGKDDKLTIGLRLSGNNPDVMDGRAIKLNVNLTGDMLNFIQQNVLLMSDPKRLLKRGQDE